MSWKNVLKEEGNEKLPKEILDAHDTEITPKMKAGMKASKYQTTQGFNRRRKEENARKKELAERRERMKVSTNSKLFDFEKGEKATHPEGFTQDTWNNLKLNYLSFTNENEMKELIGEINQEGNFSEVSRLLSRLLRLDDGIQETVLFSSRLPLKMMKERGKALQDALSTVSRKEIEDLVNDFLAGNHEGLLDYLDADVDKSNVSRRAKKVRTWVQNTEGVREKVEAELEKNPDLKQTAIGKAFGLFEQYGEESNLTTSWENIKDEIVADYLRFVTTSNKIPRAKRKKLLPKDKNGNPFERVIEGNRTKEIPAITYILKNKEFDMGDSAFQTSSSDAINRNRAISQLKRNYTTASWKKKPENKEKITTDPLQLEFDTLVDAQQKGKIIGVKRSDTRGARQATKLVRNPETGEVDKIPVPVEGRARNLNKFFNMISNPSKLQGQKGYPKLWKDLVASMGSNPRYAISTETWEALNGFLEMKDLPSETEEEIEDKEDSLEDQEDIIEELLPIGSFTDVEDLTGEYDATGEEFTSGYLDDSKVAEAIKRMKPSQDVQTVKPSTIEDVETLKKLFVGAGSAKNILSMKFPDRESRNVISNLTEDGDRFGLMTDGKLDGNLEKPEDVIELLSIIEDNFDVRPDSINDAIDDLRASLKSKHDDKAHDKKWNDTMEKLYDLLESEHYALVRKAFMDAIRKAIFEESKAVESPAKAWIMDKVG